MNTVAQADRIADWREENRAWLMARVAAVRALLAEGEHLGEGGEGAGRRASDDLLAAAAEPLAKATALRRRMRVVPALERVRADFALSPFEEWLLAACAAVELDPVVTDLCRRRGGEGGARGMSFSVAAALFPDPHWTALSPERPLRRWRILEPEVGEPITSAALRIDERVLHELLGAPHLDARLAPLVSRLGPGDLLPSHRALARRAARAWEDAWSDSPPALLLHGGDPETRLSLAAEVADAVGREPHRIAAWALPGVPAELESFSRLWEREAILAGRALVLDGLEEVEPARQASALAWAAATRAPVVVCAARPASSVVPRPLAVEIEPSSYGEQVEGWRRAAAGMDGVEALLPDLAEQFQFPPGAMAECVRDARIARDASSGADAGALLWECARRRTRGALEELARRIPVSTAWDDLVLPEAQKSVLAQVAAQMRNRPLVLHDWGFAEQAGRGLGLAVLFSGPPGTGKTMAAETLATALRLDLYVVDLSAVVSKYVGETEKNLRRVFDAAERCGAVLLFDEADALFGTRGEVKDSHDRYANIEVSYLLARMETYRGLAILTTNRKGAIDPAFLRRLRFVVEFPFPDAATRAEIWRRSFPPRTPLGPLDVARLARLDLTGGNIRTIALNAAFLAAADGARVTMVHLSAAARAEFQKLDRPFPAADLGGAA